VARSALTISKVAADCNELMVLQRTMRPSIIRVNEQLDLDPRFAASRHTPQSATLGLHPVAHKLLLISCPTKGRRLSWPEDNGPHIFQNVQGFFHSYQIIPLGDRGTRV